jgi:hypothetical protein
VLLNAQRGRFLPAASRSSFGFGHIVVESEPHVGLTQNAFPPDAVTLVGRVSQTQAGGHVVLLWQAFAQT